MHKVTSEHFMEIELTYKALGISTRQFDLVVGNLTVTVNNIVAHHCDALAYMPGW